MSLQYVNYIFEHDVFHNISMELWTLIFPVKSLFALGMSTCCKMLNRHGNALCSPNTNLKEWMCKRTRETKMQLYSQRQCNFNPSQKISFFCVVNIPRYFRSRSDFWALSCSHVLLNGFVVSTTTLLTAEQQCQNIFAVKIKDRKRAKKIPGLNTFVCVKEK